MLFPSCSFIVVTRAYVRSPFKRHIMWSFQGSWLDRQLITLELPLFFIFLTASAAVFPSNVGISALVLQQALQSYIVYRSSVSEQQHPRQRGKRDPILTHDPLANVFRSVAGTILFALIDASFLAYLTDALGKTGFLSAAKLFWCSFISYWTVVMSEYMVHRFIWHAHWMRHRHKVARLFSHAHFHYVHHYLAHHKHAMDPDTKTRMLEGAAEPHNPDKKRSIEAQFKTQTEEYSATQQALDCSNHGFTVGTWQCRISTVALYFLCPTGFSVIMHVLYRDWLSALVHLMMSSLAVYMAIQHQAFHCSREALARWATRRVCLERWFWTSGAMSLKAEEHKKHHYSYKHGDIEFCGVLPFGHFVLFPIWQMW